MLQYELDFIFNIGERNLIGIAVLGIRQLEKGPESIVILRVVDTEEHRRILVILDVVKEVFFCL